MLRKVDCPYSVGYLRYDEMLSGQMSVKLLSYSWQPLYCACRAHITRKCSVL